MGKTYLLYNPASGNGRGEKAALSLKENQNFKDFIPVDITGENEESLSHLLSDCERVVVCGGDGTLNSFINKTDCDHIPFEVYFYPTGSGNDFLLDIGMASTDSPVNISKYIKNLPVVSVNGKKFKFINGAGAGIDGYCCDECNRIRKEKKKKVSYVAIALKGILGFFSPLDAEVIADGVSRKYKSMWLSPVMKGRYCGGGLKLAPDQKREGNLLTFVTAHDISRARLLTILPSAFSGGHVKYKKYVDIIEGKSFTVKFTRPTTLQIDGETIKNVSEFTAQIPIHAKI